MATEFSRAADFYATPQGAVVARLLRARLGEVWPVGEGRGLSFLGLGHAAPYLRLWREGAARCVAVSPGRAAGRWPGSGAPACCAAEEDALPFPDLSFDRILLVHGLETAGNTRGLLREVWRVLKDDGRLLVVAPNRNGMWAHVETTPFGQGQPYSAGQVERLLAGAMFRVERREAALYLPPTRLRLVLRTARLWEAAGRQLAPQLAGVTISEAVKDVYAAVPLRQPVRRRLVLADAA